MTKKILSFLLVLVMTVCLVACGAKVDESIKVNFNTNGGNEIGSVEVKADDVANFKLPENPVKEGYVFKGWYIDAEFKNAYEKVDITKGELTLYAKWEVAKTPEEMNAEELEGNWYAAGSNVEFTADNKVKLNLMLPTGATELEGSYTVDAVGNVTFKFDGTPLSVPLTAKLDGSKLTFSALGQTIELKKAPKFELVAVPTELIEFVKNFNGGELTSTGKFEVKTTPTAVPATEENNTSDGNANDQEGTTSDGSGSTASDVIGEVIEGVVKGVMEAIVQMITNSHVKLEYATTIKVNNIKSDKVEDLEAYINFKGQLELSVLGEKVDDPEFNTYVEMLKDIKIYVKDGKAYATVKIPTKAVDETNTENETYIYTNTEVTFSVDLTEIAEFVKGMLEEVPVEEMESEIPAELTELVELLKKRDANAVCEYINNTINTLLATVYSYGIEPEFVQGVVNVFKRFAPAVKVEGNKTTISYTEAQVDKAFDDLAKFLTDNKEMIKFIATALESMSEKDADEPASEEPSFDESFGEAVAAVGMVKDALTIKDCYLSTTKANGAVSAVDKKFEIEVNFGSFVLYVDIENTVEVKAYTGFELPTFEETNDVTGMVLEGLMSMISDSSDSDYELTPEY